jgi:hypothetical protein
MTEGQPQPEPTKPPPRINGPALLVFGIMSLVIGLSIEMIFFTVAGIVIILVGAYGVWALKRYEKAEGIEETLPGGGRYDAHGNLRDREDD